MAVQIRNANREQMLIFSPSLDDWVDKNDSVRFYVETVKKLVNIYDFHLNNRGTGDKMYDPVMLLTLVLYSFSQGRFSTRKMEKATRNDIPTRFLTANQFPDHTTIARFINNNGEIIRKVFVKIILLAKEMGLVTMKCVCVDGSCFRANASMAKNRTTAQLKEEVDRLQRLCDAYVAKTQEAEKEESDDDDQQLPDTLNTQEKLQKQLERAQQKLRERQQLDEETEAQMSEKDKARLSKYRKEKAEYEKNHKKLRESLEPQVMDVSRPDDEEDDENHDDNTPSGGSEDDLPKPPKCPMKSQNSTQPLEPCECLVNTTDLESRCMVKKTAKGKDQCWNVQCAVDTDSRIIVTTLVTNEADTQCLLDVADATQKTIGPVKEIGADGGYFSKSNLRGLDSRGIRPIIPSQVPITKEPGKKHHLKNPYLIQKAKEAASPHGRETLRKRKTTVEPLFGILKSVLGFRGFFRRGKEKVNQEFSLLASAVNLRRLSGQMGFQW